MKGTARGVAICTALACILAGTASAHEFETEHLLVVEDQTAPPEVLAALHDQLIALGLEILRPLHGRLEGLGNLWGVPEELKFSDPAKAVRRIPGVARIVSKPYPPPFIGPFGDDCINILDLIGVRNHLNQETVIDNIQYDWNEDGRINVLDMIEVRNHMNIIVPTLEEETVDGAHVKPEEIRLQLHPDTRAAASEALVGIGFRFGSIRAEGERWHFYQEEYYVADAMEAAREIAGVLHVSWIHPGLTPDSLCLLPGDMNDDGTVNILDLMFVRNRLNEDPASGDNWKADVNADGKIDVLDVLAVRKWLGADCTK